MSDKKHPKLTNKNGVVLNSGLDKVLYGERPKLRTNSVSSPSAHTNKLCDDLEVPGAKVKALLHDRESILRQNPKLWYVIELMMAGGLRVSEVLNISAYDITTLGHIRIKGSKGSSDRVVRVFDGLDYMLRCKENSVAPFRDISRYYVYREFKKLGITHKFFGKAKASVTHFFRQLVSRSMEEENFTDEQRRQFLGHKGKSSLKHYSNGKEESD